MSTIEVREVPYAKLRKESLASRSTNGQLQRQLDLEAAYHDGVKRGRAGWIVAGIIGKVIGAALALAAVKLLA